MPLTTCADCGHQMSADAMACPGCGRPNARAARKATDSKQGTGCVIFIIGCFLALFTGPIGAIIAVVGLVIMLANTRLK